MKRSLARRRIAQKVVALAFLGLGLLTTGCSGRNVRPDGLHNTNQGATVQSIEMEDLHITVGKGSKAGEEDFTAYDAPTLFREADADAARALALATLSIPRLSRRFARCSMPLSAMKRWDDLARRRTVTSDSWRCIRRASKPKTLRCDRPPVWQRSRAGCSPPRRWLSSRSVKI